MGEENNKEFWLKLGADIAVAKDDSAEAKECSKQMSEKLDRFINNEFHHLEEKVDKINIKIAKLMGGISVAWILAQVVIKTLLK